MFHKEEVSSPKTEGQEPPRKKRKTDLGIKPSIKRESDNLSAIKYRKKQHQAIYSLGILISNSIKNPPDEKKRTEDLNKLKKLTKKLARNICIELTKANITTEDEALKIISHNQQKQSKKKKKSLKCESILRSKNSDPGRKNQQAARNIILGHIFIATPVTLDYEKLMNHLKIFCPSWETYGKRVSTKVTKPNRKRKLKSESDVDDEVVIALARPTRASSKKISYEEQQIDIEDRAESKTASHRHPNKQRHASPKQQNHSSSAAASSPQAALEEQLIEHQPSEPGPQEPQLDILMSRDPSQLNLHQQLQPMPNLMMPAPYFSTEMAPLQQQDQSVNPAGAQSQSMLNTGELSEALQLPPLPFLSTDPLPSLDASLSANSGSSTSRLLNRFSSCSPLATMSPQTSYGAEPELKLSLPTPAPFQQASSLSGGGYSLADLGLTSEFGLNGPEEESLLDIPRPPNGMSL